MTKAKSIVLATIAIVIGVWLWWQFGPGLSEETSYRLAMEQARGHAMQRGIDLNRYDVPSIGSQAGQRLYSFSWTPKDGKGVPLTVAVDSQIVEVSVVQSPVGKIVSHFPASDSSMKIAWTP